MLGKCWGADGGEGADGRKQIVVDETFRKMETCVIQQITWTPKFFPGNPGILQHLLKAPLKCVTEFLTYKSGRCLQVAVQRLEKGIIKT